MFPPIQAFIPQRRQHDTKNSPRFARDILVFILSSLPLPGGTPNIDFLSNSSEPGLHFPRSPARQIAHFYLRFARDFLICFFPGIPPPSGKLNIVFVSLCFARISSPHEALGHCSIILFSLTFAPSCPDEHSNLCRRSSRFTLCINLFVFPGFARPSCKPSSLLVVLHALCVVMPFLFPGPHRPRWLSKSAPS